MKISLEKKMDSKYHQVCHNHQCCQQQREHQGEALGQAPEPAQGDLYQDDPLAMNWPMLDPIYARQSSTRHTTCKTSTRMNKGSSIRPSMATSTPNNPSFKNKDAHQDPTRRDFECFSRNPKRNRNSYWRIVLYLILIIIIVNAD